MLQSTEQHHDYASIPTWYLASAFSSDQAFNSFDCLLEPSLSMPKTPGLSKRQRHWSSEADPETTSEDVLGLHTLARTSLAGAWSLLDLSEASLSSMNSEDARTAITSVRCKQATIGLSADLRVAVGAYTALYSDCYIPGLRTFRVLGQRESFGGSAADRRCRRKNCSHSVRISAGKVQRGKRVPLRCAMTLNW
jgi:hypothetical protein